VSCDSVESHQAFKKKYSIPFVLLADTDGKLCDAFGVPNEKYPQRSTFLIDADGTVRKVWPKVKVEDHALDVLSNL
jgi:thioredoxin-dependent peroxiredoxin